MAFDWACSDPVTITGVAVTAAARSLTLHVWEGVVCTGRDGGGERRSGVILVTRAALRIRCWRCPGGRCPLLLPAQRGCLSIPSRGRMRCTCTQLAGRRRENKCTYPTDMDVYGAHRRRRRRRPQSSPRLADRPGQQRVVDGGRQHVVSPPARRHQHHLAHPPLILPPPPSPPPPSIHAVISHYSPPRLSPLHGARSRRRRLLSPRGRGRRTGYYYGAIRLLPIPSTCVDIRPKRESMCAMSARGGGRRCAAAGGAACGRARP